MDDVLRGKFEAEGTNRIYDDNFKFIGDLTHEASNLLHQDGPLTPHYQSTEQQIQTKYSEYRG